MARHLAFANGDRRKRPYWRDGRLLGKHLIDLQEEEILVIGKDSWSRQEIVDLLHCGNFVAAQNLSKLAKKLDVESLEQLLSRFTMEDLLAETGVGVVTIFVLMCAMDSRKKDPMKYVNRKPADIVTLSSEKRRAVKHHEEAAQARKRAATGARKQAAAAAS
jgi:hypothetical protein